MSLLFVCLVSGILAYLVGSLSTAVIVCRTLGLQDPRSAGSNNPGATNVLRIGGKKAAALTLLGDALKGLIPVIIVVALKLPPLVVALTAVGAFLGHLYPIFFQFKGGKGVATALGCIIGLNYLVALCAFGIWLLVFATTRISSLAALIAAVCAPLFLWLFHTPIHVVIAVIFMDVLLIIRHKANIQRLISGEEGRLKSKN